MKFADPQTNVLQLGLRDGMKVADLGVGSGHYAIAAAHAIGESGRVYAVDVQEELLAHVRDAASQVRLRNIETVWGDIEKQGGTKLKPDSMDAVILSNVLFQVKRKEAAVAEVKRVIAPEGKLLIVDWAGAFGGIGPRPEHVIPERRAEELFTDAGFLKVKSFNAGAHHYAIVFRAPAA